MMELSVVVLCYHSGQVILELVENLKRLLEYHKVDYELILVANDFANSKDETINIVKQLANNQPRITPITKIKEGMMGWDMLQGFNACTGKYICVIDGDGQFPIESVINVYFEIRNSEFDIVKTFRVERSDGTYRTRLSQFYNFIFTVLYPGLGSKDVNSKPKILTRKAYSELKLESTDWFIDAEIMIKARKLHLKFKELPITFSANESRKSFVRYDAIFEFLWHLIQFKFRKF
jgi:glycosyltransferase involved in cell wall biosynthesis